MEDSGQEPAGPRNIGAASTHSSDIMDNCIILLEELECAFC